MWENINKQLATLKQHNKMIISYAQKSFPKFYKKYKMVHFAKGSKMNPNGPNQTP